jgi:hypothetical protein
MFQKERTTYPLNCYISWDIPDADPNKHQTCPRIDYLLRHVNIGRQVIRKGIADVPPMDFQY